MASSVALRRLAGKDLLSGNIFRPFRSLSSTRAFNTNTQMTRVDDDDVDDRSSISRRRDFPTGILPDVFDPFAPTRSVSQLMNFMDQLMENSASRMGMGGGGAMKRGWDVKEDKEALRLKVDMPGLGKEDVKVSVEENTLIIKGEAEKETEEMEDRRRYSTRIDLSPNMYKIDGIKAEMNNGVLKIVLPKLKPEERKDVFQVQIE
ncbi:small heat shock protein, chloroplastic [Amaranthus tricolor]|uniref:small heat shock protein, chloroplastic n=1 Tax=Amaranthus tricolor TaxID=29722 RepID=UPI002589D387|nr:small heat shock protein, chloroplastic [Amaranthus tricolor]